MDKETKVIIVGASSATRKAIVAALINQIAICEVRVIDFNRPIAITAPPKFDDILCPVSVDLCDLGPIKHRKGGKKSRRIWRP